MPDSEQRRRSGSGPFRFRRSVRSSRAEEEGTRWQGARGPESARKKILLPMAGVAGATGFEPVAFGFGVESERLPRDPQASLGVVFPPESDQARSLPSRSIPAEHGNFGAPVVHGKAGSRRVNSCLLTVREVAALLRVCRATVYSLCERGQLAH